MNVLFDEIEIRKAICTLKSDNQLFEIRIIQGRISASGYFDDADNLIKALRNNADYLAGGNVYMTLHQLHDGCRARLQWNRFIDSGRAKIPTTSDHDVLRYKYIPIDLDPVRPSGISSNAEELKSAETVARQVVEYMSGEGFTERIEAFSGNGYHLLYPIDLPNNEESERFIKECLNNLDQQFSNDRCHVDVTNYNPSRVFKLYGTVAQKGRSTEDRPHRLARILGVHQVCE